MKTATPLCTRRTAIICGNSEDFSFWLQTGQIRIFVIYAENGLMDSYRLVYGATPIYNGETEIRVEDLFQPLEDD